MPRQRVVYKYPLPDGANRFRFSVSMPTPHKFVHFGPDGDGKLCVWFEVNPDAPNHTYGFLVVGTGTPFGEPGLHHFATIVDSVGEVWHLYGPSILHSDYIIARLLQHHPRIMEEMGIAHQLRG